MCRIVASALATALAGMHSAVSPTARLHWRRRHVLLPTLAAPLPTTAMQAGATTMVLACREAMRRFVLAATRGSLATHAALRRVRHPLSLLEAQTQSEQARQFAISCDALARAGAALLDKAARADDPTIATVAAAVQESLVVRSGGAGRKSASPPGTAKAFNADYLSRVQPMPFAGHTAVSIGGSVFQKCFAANYLPFWLAHFQSGYRPLRLSPSQHEALHGANAATRLTLLLTEQEQLAAQRAALANSGAGILRFGEARELLGIAKLPASRPVSAASNLTAAAAVAALATVARRDAARMLAFARTASLCEQRLTYDLGDGTAHRQLDALCRRLLLAELPDFASLPIDERLARLPAHATNLLICRDCARVANPLVVDTSPPSRMIPWTEIGATSSMSQLDTETGEARLCCARRCSASMKAAQVFCAEAEARVPGDEAAQAELTRAVLRGSAVLETGAAAKARRDAAVALSQRAHPKVCGDTDLVAVPLLGRAVRYAGSIYMLCELCASVVQLHPSHRVAGVVCCLRCSPKMLDRHAKPKHLDPLKKSPACRYCGKEDPMRTGTRWKAYRAPNDVSGDNRDLPPTLRRIYLCPSHVRSWVAPALKCFDTRVLLVRPCCQKSRLSSRRPVHMPELVSGSIHNTALTFRRILHWGRDQFSTAQEASTRNPWRPKQASSRRRNASLRNADASPAPARAATSCAPLDSKIGATESERRALCSRLLCILASASSCARGGFMRGGGFGLEDICSHDHELFQ